MMSQINAPIYSYENDKNPVIDYKFKINEYKNRSSRLYLKSYIDSDLDSKRPNFNIFNQLQKKTFCIKFFKAKAETHFLQTNYFLFDCLFGKFSSEAQL